MDRGQSFRILALLAGLLWLTGCQSLDSLSSVSQRRGLPAQTDALE
ncbi:hypothetical protein [Planctomicrobium sp. SH664]